MYVTDRPVMDRLTDPLLSAVGGALDVLTEAGFDLDCLTYDLERAESVPDGLPEARDAVLSASELVAGALAQGGIEPL